MLHILWILIKFILIILGILLGLVLLAVLLLLFCPVRYQAKAVKETDSFKEAELEARVTWLFRAIGARFFFHNGEGKLVITLFGVSLETIKSWLGKLKGGSRKDSGSRSTQSREKKKRTSAQSKPIPQKTGKKKPDDKSQAEVVQQENAPAEPRRQKPIEIVQLENTSAEPPVVEPSAPEQEENTEPEAGPGLFARIGEILSKIIRLPAKLWNKITSLIKGIIEKIRNIKKTISEITDKLGWWKEFLTNERTKAAISLVWKDAKGLIHHVLPTKVEGEVAFGCDDPAITGTALAILGMTFPFHKNRIQVTPLFDGGNQLTGNVSLKGRIYGIMFIKAAIEIYFNKNIKYVINRWKHKED